MNKLLPGELSDESFAASELRPINCFYEGSLGTAETAKPALDPEHLFFTSTGRIGVILHISDGFALTMTALQRNLGDVIIGPGDVHHARQVHLFALIVCLLLLTGRAAGELLLISEGGLMLRYRLDSLTVTSSRITSHILIKQNCLLAITRLNVLHHLKVS